MKSNKLSYKVRLKGTDEWVTLDDKQFNSLSLEDGLRMPEIQGNKVIVTNYFNTFWGRIMGARNFRVFMVLSQYAFGSKDFVYPSLQTLSDICDLSPNTVKTAVRELEELGFVIQVQTINEFEENENNIYIIRKTTPFLSVEQYQSLPKRLQDSHTKYIRNIEESERIALSNAPDYPQPSKTDKGTSKKKRGGSNIDTPTPNPEKPVENDENSQKGGSNIDIPPSEIEVRQNLIDGGSNIDGGVGQNLTPNKYNLLITTKLNQLNNNINQFQIDFLDFAKEKLSKPSFDTWFSRLQVRGFDTERGVLTFTADNKMQKEWLDSRYLKYISGILEEHFDLPGITVHISLYPDRT